MLFRHLLSKKLLIFSGQFHRIKFLQFFTRYQLINFCLLIICFFVFLRVEQIRPIYAVRQAVFDYYQWLFPRPRDEVPVAVVVIDEKGLAQEGQWPWSRARVAELVTKLNLVQPLAIGIDISFSEQDRLAPKVLAKRFPQISQKEWDKLPDPDLSLADAVGKGKVALGVFALNQIISNKDYPPLVKNLVILQPEGIAIDRLAGGYRSSLPALPPIEQAAAGSGLLNTIADPDVFSQEHGVVRHIPLITNVAGQAILTLGFEMMRIAMDYPPVEAISEKSIFFQGITNIKLGDFFANTRKDGAVSIYFGKFLNGYDDRYISAADILNGSFAVEQLHGRFIIIGFNALGLNDMVTTPLGEYVPGVDVHAQLIENILSNKTLSRPYQLVWLEYCLFWLLAVLMFIFIPKMKASAIAFFALFLVIALPGLGLLLFKTQLYLFDGIALIITLFPCYFILFRNRMYAVEIARTAAQRQLQKNRENNARISGELDAARRIQFGLLPNATNFAPNDQRFQLAVKLESAKEISGDFYDFFILDDQYLYFSLGDVSGKGVPASLFMSMAKTLTATHVGRNFTDLGRAMQFVESELNRNNSESLFVTCLIGVLNLQTGSLSLANAGHDEPILIRSVTNSAITEVSNIDTSEYSGPPLCALGDYPFSGGNFQLNLGDTFCVFTDGITEATYKSSDKVKVSQNQQYQIYGRDRIMQHFATLPADSSAQEYTESLYNDVLSFVQGQDASDDATILTIKWLGGKNEK